jgi:hypothetical protein
MTLEQCRSSCVLYTGRTARAGCLRGGNGDEQVKMMAATLPLRAPDTWTLSNSTRWAGLPCPEPIGGQDAPLAEERRLRGVPTRRDRSPATRSILIPSSCDLSNHPCFVVWPESDGQVAKKKGRAMRANAPEWEPGRLDTLETLLSDFVPPFPASRRPNVGALPRKVSRCQTGLWGDAGWSELRGLIFRCRTSGKSGPGYRR